MLKYLLPFIILINSITVLPAQKLVTQEELIEISYSEKKKRNPFFASSGQTLIRICGLKKGSQYALRNSFGNNITCELSITQGGTLLLNELPNMLIVQVEKNCLVLLLKTSAKINREYAVLTISEINEEAEEQSQPVGVKSAGITTSGGMTSDSLIKDIFIGGNCFDADGIEPIGEAAGKGTFDNGQAFIGFGEGVILATGNIANAEGPNTIPDATTGFSGAIQFDPDLFQLGGGWPLYDIVGIEFDFIPTDTIVEFEYVFASEEYCEYVNSQFNDVFGFFISGPGINGGFSNNAINLAVVPGTNTPVSINSINDINNDAYYVDNIPPGHAPWLWGAACAVAIGSPAAAVGGCQYDGFTVPMTARAKVIPCEKYHIKLVVADVGDEILDAAVFLKANSFGGEPLITSAFSGSGATDDAMEDCEMAGFVFTRDSSNIDSSFEVGFEIDPSSTALEGIDYDSIPSSIIILPGQTEAVLPISVFADNLIEGQESIILNIDEACSCSDSSVVLYLNDRPPMELELADETICINEPLELSPVVLGGVGPYQFEWSTGQSGPSILIFPTADTVFTVTVRDSCGQEETTTINVSVEQGVQAEISGQIQVCGQVVNEVWPIHFTNGTAPYTIGYTINGGSTMVVDDIADNPYLLPINETGVYELVSVDDGGCQGSAIGTFTVTPYALSAVGTVEHLSCFESSDGQINAGSPSGGFAPYTYQWSHIGMGGTVQDGLPAGNYEVTISDERGCELVQEFEVLQPDLLVATIFEVVHLDCSNGGGTLKMGGSGGTFGYSFEWNNGGTSPHIFDLPAGAYYVTVTDENGCTAIDSATILALDALPILQAETDTLTCEKEEVFLNGVILNTTGDFNFAWSDQYFNTIAQAFNITVNQPGQYFFWAENTANGCRDTISIEVVEDLEQPQVVINDPDTLTCAVEEVQFEATSSITNPIYNWSVGNVGQITTPTDLSGITVNAPGDYIVEVLNPENGCTNLSYTLVQIDTVPPTPLILANNNVITCEKPNVFADASASYPTGDLTFSWASPNGNIATDPNLSMIEVDMAGDYELTLTNVENGCSSSLGFSFTDDFEPPQITLSDPLTLTCDLEETTLTASADVPSASFVWSAGGGGQIVSGADQPDITVNMAGEYFVEVANPVNGCLDSASVVVGIDTVPPTALIATPNDLNCTIMQVALDATGSSTGAVFEYLWTPDQTGNIVGGDSTLSPVVDAGGTYSLLIENTDNGCTQLAEVTVGIDTTAPIATASVMGELNCTVDQLNLNGTGSSTGSGFSYDWQGPGLLTGTNTLSPLINLPGEYFIEVTNLQMAVWIPPVLFWKLIQCCQWLLLLHQMI